MFAIDLNAYNNTLALMINHQRQIICVVDGCEVSKHFSEKQQLVVALESVGSQTMNRKMKSTLQGEFDGIPSRRDQPNKWAQHIQLPPAIQLETRSSEDPRQ
jgi:hypothetical protein